MLTGQNFKTLYLCYFGLHEPLVQTQVLPYLREIQKGGTEVSLLTFEPEFKKTWTAEKIEAERKKLARENIDWDALGYHKRPSVPATFYDTFCGAWATWRWNRRKKFDVFHVRVHTPAMMGVIARKFIFGKKPKLLFDIRGFFPEEYTDAGVWKENGRLYKTVKKVEKRLLKEADGFVVLTERAREILFPESAENGFDKNKRPVEVIPCCIDAKRFEASKSFDRDEIRREIGVENRTVFVYVGSFGGWYLTDEMIDFFVQAHRQTANAFTLILTQRDVEKVKESLIKTGLSEKDFLVKSVAPNEIPKYLTASDIALSFIKECYSKQASSPTKIAEYLACGLPIVANAGVGDLDDLIEGEKVGVILRGFDEKSYADALNKINALVNEKEIREHCRQIADKMFDLEKIGGERYRRLYERLLKS